MNKIHNSNKKYFCFIFHFTCLALFTFERLDSVAGYIETIQANPVVRDAIAGQMNYLIFAINCGYIELKANIS